MRLRQTLAVAICCLLCALDGFDVLAITFAAPGIASDWGIDPASVGLIISMGLAGMVVGSLTMGQLADRIGRRRQILLCLGIMSVGMLASAFSTSVWQLCTLRVVTGLGLGAMLASINAMAAEFSNLKRRDLAVSVMAAGYPIGGVAGGWIASQLLRSNAWEAIFLFGGVATLAMVPLVLALLPESVGWLAVSGRADALSRINRILRRLGHPVAGEIADQGQKRKPSMAAIFATDLSRTTWALVIIYACHMITFYYALGWAPSLVVALGFDKSAGTLISVFLNLGGVTGGMIFGIMAMRFGLRPLLVFLTATGALAVVGFGMVPADLAALKGAAFILGFLSNGAVVGLYSLIARSYPAELRSGGTGMVIGLGRIGAAFGPVIAGLLLSSGADRTVTSAVMALGSIAAAFILFSANIEGAPKPVSD